MQTQALPPSHKVKFQAPTEPYLDPTHNFLPIPATWGLDPLLLWGFPNTQAV